MARENEGYRDQLESIIAAFPNSECLTVTEVAQYCGRDARTVAKLFPFVGKGWTRYITRTTLARCLVGGK